MAQEEDKQLLLQDLCARLPYGVKVLDNSHQDYGVSNLINIGLDGSMLIDNEINDIQYYPIINEVKPYLRDMKDMTDEEKKEYDTLGNHCISTSIGFVHLEVQELIDWLNKKHFNWRGLPEDRYIRVTKENNPY